MSGYQYGNILELTAAGTALTVSVRFFFKNTLFNNLQESSVVPQLILGIFSQFHRQLSESMSVYFGTIMAKHSFYRFGTYSYAKSTAPLTKREGFNSGFFRKYCALGEKKRIIKQREQVQLTAYYSMPYIFRTNDESHARFMRNLSSLCIFGVFIVVAEQIIQPYNKNNHGKYRGDYRKVIDFDFQCYNYCSKAFCLVHLVLKNLIYSFNSVLVLPEDLTKTCSFFVKGSPVLLGICSLDTTCLTENMMLNACEINYEMNADVLQHAAPHIHMTNGKALQASASAIKTSTIPVIKRQRQNWLDASDDGFFIATEETRKCPSPLPGMQTPHPDQGESRAVSGFASRPNCLCRAGLHVNTVLSPSIAAHSHFGEEAEFFHKWGRATLVLMALGAPARALPSLQRSFIRGNPSPCLKTQTENLPEPKPELRAVGALPLPPLSPMCALI
ncbi:hypothetical protein IHE44_0009043 [Lamprotornis superbus]|uniref:Uncharacterized protein n=1 Tax=Lamprotornis superbus TaxID=245042 RepID=A0A835TZE8_9PASS|nr:hypothetical protein IHE44_0009043 [Lamprotornis superbus]